MTTATLVPPSAGYLGLSVETRADGLAGGALPWQQGRILVWSFDDDHRHLRFWPAEAAAITGSQDWTAQGLVIPIDGRVKAVRVIAYNASPSGELCLRDLQLTGLRETQAFTVLRFALWPAWICALLWISYSAARTPGSRALKAGVYLTAAVTLVMILLPQPHYARLVEPAGEALGAWLAASEFAQPGQSVAQSSGVGRPDPEAPARIDEERHQHQARPMGPAQKSEEPALGTGLLRILSDWFSLEEAVHAAAFALLAVLACLAFPGVSLVVLGSSLCLAVVGSEAMQLMLITRSGEAADLIADLAGAAVGLVAAALLRLGLGSRRGGPPDALPPPL